jgi:hypothetical protein
LAAIAKNAAIAVPKGVHAIEARNGQTPAFTLDDAKKFVLDHRAPGAAGYIDINRAEFMTSKQIYEVLDGVETGLPGEWIPELRENSTTLDVFCRCLKTGLS